MLPHNRPCRCRCAPAALLAGGIPGMLAAFLHISGTITVTVSAVGAALGLEAVYLGLLLIAAALSGQRAVRDCDRSVLNISLAGIPGTLLPAGILLAVGITPASVLTAIAVGGLVFFLVLTASGAARCIRSLAAVPLPKTEKSPG